MAAPVGILKKIVAADSDRISRIHDGVGNVVSFSEIISLPQRLFENINARRGVYPKMPWWPRLAARAIEKILSAQTEVLEFGTGMSTIWMAERVKSIISIETDEYWSRKVLGALKASNIENVEVLVRTEDSYFDIPVRKYDFIVIDAWRRGDCTTFALNNIRNGGYIYLDNSDLDRDGKDHGVHNFARKSLLDFVAAGRGRIQFFNGYPPGNLAPTEGALFQLQI